MKLLRSLLLVVLLSTPLFAQQTDTYCNPLDVEIADPFVLKHDGTYYLYGTSRARDGFEVWSSKDLVRWQQHGFAYRKTDGQWPRNMFWAAECFEHKGKFYLHGSAVGDTADRHRLMLAVADSPLGPFKLLAAPWVDPGYCAIDGHIFKDTDGKLYLFYVRDARENKFSAIYVRRLSDDLLSFEGEPAECAKPEQRWEGTLINEGPFVMKHGDTYFMMYSGNGATDTWYAVGYATARSPMGPWTKFDKNPILRRTKEVSGPGHHSVIDSPDGKEMFIVYHTHQQPKKPWWNRQLAIDRMQFVETPDGVQMKVNGPTWTPQPMPSGAPAIVQGVSDEFDSRTLERDRWMVRNERDDRWSLADGWLVIDTQIGEAKAMQTNLHNLFLTEPPPGDFEVMTRLKFSPTDDGESAFLTVWQDHNNFVRLSMTQAGGRKIELATERDAEYTVVKSIDNPFGDDVYFRIAKRGNRYAFDAGPDGKTWQTLAADISVDLIDPSVAIGAVSPAARVKGQARFDFLRFAPLESSSSAR